MSSPILELHAIVRGKVQGVFFRATACEHAQALGLRGTIKNLPDGTVEIFAQGTQNQLENLLQMLKKQPGKGRVERIDTTFSEPRTPFEAFSITA